MIYCIKIDQLAAALATGDSLSNSDGTKSNSYLTSFPLNIPMHDIKADILTAEEVRLLCFLENEIRDGVSELDKTALKSYRSLKKNIRSLENCVVSAKENCYPINDCNLRETLDAVLLENDIGDACSVEMQTKHAGYLTSNTGRTASTILGDLSKEDHEAGTSMVNLLVEQINLLTNEELIPDSKEVDPPDGDTEIYKELLDYYTTFFVHYLEAATIRRVYNLPRDGGDQCKHSESNVPSVEKDPSRAAKIGILFSGGIDSMVLAAVADRYDFNCDSCFTNAVVFNQGSIRSFTNAMVDSDFYSPL